MKTFFAVIIIVVGIAVAGYFFMNRKADLSLSPTPSPSSEASASPSATPNTTIMDITKLEAEILAQGKGTGAKTGDNLSVLYKGTLTNGQVFDASSLRDNKPFTLTLGAGQVIKGWDIGLVGMKVGEKRKLYIPSELAYGPNGIPNSPIGPNADLIFEVELLTIGK